MTATTCPPEHELLPLAMGEPAASDVAMHLAWCRRCNRRLRRLIAEVRTLRREIEVSSKNDRVAVPD
jgi:hypothetical protein